MSTDNERDTHFQNFAKLLMEELMQPNGYIDVSDGWLDEDEIAGYQQIIARRAYDLVLHAANCMDSAWLDRLDMAEIPVRIPDMTSFPEQTQQ